MNILRNIVAGGVSSLTVHTVHGMPMTLSADLDDLAHKGWRINVPISPAALLKINMGLYGNMETYGGGGSRLKNLHESVYSGAPLMYDVFGEYVYLPEHYYAKVSVAHRFFALSEEEDDRVMGWLRGVLSKGKCTLDAAKMRAKASRPGSKDEMTVNEICAELDVDGFDRMWNLWEPKDFQKFNPADHGLPRSLSTELDLFDLIKDIGRDHLNADSVAYMKESMKR